jgi:hypothetical protein
VAPQQWLGLDVERNWHGLRSYVVQEMQKSPGESAKSMHGWAWQAGKRGLISTKRGQLRVRTSDYQSNHRREVFYPRDTPKQRWFALSSAEIILALFTLLPHGLDETRVGNFSIFRDHGDRLVENVPVHQVAAATRRCWTRAMSTSIRPWLGSAGAQAGSRHAPVWSPPCCHS